MFAEKISGTVTDRKTLAALGAGDVLLVTRLDRHARSTRGLLAGSAEFERSLILARGPGPWPEKSGSAGSLTAHQVAEAKARRAAGEALTSRSYVVSHSTISRL